MTEARNSLLSIVSLLYFTTVCNDRVKSRLWVIYGLTKGENYYKVLKKKYISGSLKETEIK